MYIAVYIVFHFFDRIFKFSVSTTTFCLELMSKYTPFIVNIYSLRQRYQRGGGGAELGEGCWVFQRSVAGWRQIPFVFFIWSWDFSPVRGLGGVLLILLSFFYILILWLFVGYLLRLSFHNFILNRYVIGCKLKPLHLSLCISISWLILR